MPYDTSNPDKFLSTIQLICFGANLKKDDIEAIRLILEHDTAGEKLGTLKHYLETLDKPMAVNRKLAKVDTVLANALEQNDDVNLQKLQHAVNQLHRVTYKMRHASEQSYQSMQKLMTSSQNLKKKIPDEVKLSLKDASIANDMASIADTLNEWFEGAPDQAPTLLAYANLSKTFVEKLSSQSLDRLPQGRTFFGFDNQRKLQSIRGEEESRLERIWQAACKKVTHAYEHTASMQLESSAENPEQKTLQQSHLTYRGVKNQDEADFESLLYTDLYLLDVTKLIPESEHHKLEAIYGEHWKQLLNALYGLCERKVHDDMIATRLEFRPLKDVKSYVKAGAESTFLHGPLSQLGTSFHSQLDKAMNRVDDKGKTRMLCSQYTAYTTALALERLNQQVLEMTQTHNKTSAQQVKFKDGPIKPPFPKHQKMAMMHPGKLFKLLDKKGCLEKIEHRRVNRFVKA